MNEVVSSVGVELKEEEGWTRLGYAVSFPLSPELVQDNCPRINCLEVNTPVHWSIT